MAAEKLHTEVQAQPVHGQVTRFLSSSLRDSLRLTCSLMILSTSALKVAVTKTKRTFWGTRENILRKGLAKDSDVRRTSASSKIMWVTFSRFGMQLAKAPGVELIMSVVLNRIFWERKRRGFSEAVKETQCVVLCGLGERSDLETVLICFERAVVGESTTT